MPGTLSRGAFRRIAIGILLVAAAWRISIAVVMPCAARDSVEFCWFARDLGRQGLAYLRLPSTDQHPLFPATLLAAQRVARLAGAPDTPLTWQRSGQAVCVLTGLAVVALAGALAVRVVRRLQLPVDERAAGCCAMLMAALLPLNVWLSAEAMSDELHLAFYLVGVLALLKLDSLKTALLCGLASGLAFLTSEEGAMVAVAGLIAVAADRRVSWRRRGGRAAALAAAFLVCAVPFWATVGKLSTKKNPADWFAGGYGAAGGVAGAWGRVDEIAEANANCYEGDLVLAKLIPADVAWYALVPRALHELLRAGRVVVPLLALLPLLNLRRRLLRPPLFGLTACFVGHFAAAVFLLHRYGYLDQRHMLVAAMLLVPPAAVLLARLVELARMGRSRVLVAAAVALVALPLGLYSLRTPNADARCMTAAARWLVARDPEVPDKRLLSGSSAKRIAFYADMRWEPWYEKPEAYETLVRQIHRGGPGYFAIMLEPSGGEGKTTEATGNRALMERLLADRRVSPRLWRVHVEPGWKGAELHLLELGEAGDR